MTQASLGIIGLGGMGRNLALNMARNGFTIAGYAVDLENIRPFLEGLEARKRIISVDDLSGLMASLEKPRRILLMVTPGAAVDEMIGQIKPHLEPGDILIDGGNSYFMDTDRRSNELANSGINFVGMGVSGGADGALQGPCLMPGGPRKAWEALAPILRGIAARAEEGEPCVAYMGPRGAGHYVNMVLNSIEYAEMQLIAEVYDLMHRGAGLSAAELHNVFQEWNQGLLKSYLVEITADIFSKIDEETNLPLVDVILDEAQQKNTGSWTSQNALDVGVSIPTIVSAEISRILSGQTAERVEASCVLADDRPEYQGDHKMLVDAVGNALYAARITCYGQALSLLRTASNEYKYELDLGEITRIWRAGCIIRASLLGEITAAYQRNPQLSNLLLDVSFSQAVLRRQAAWRFVIQTAVGMGIPVMALSSSLAYFDAYRSERLPANLTQAQRDYFGAQSYRRMDREGEFHTQWT